MAVMTFTPLVSAPGQTTNLTISQTGSSYVTVSDTIAGSATTNIAFTCDVSAVKMFQVTSTVAATLKTNSSGSPVDTITLVANQPYVWYYGAYDTFKLGTDVTTLYFTVAGATAGTVTIDCLTDATP